MTELTRESRSSLFADGHAAGIVPRRRQKTEKVTRIRIDKNLPYAILSPRVMILFSYKIRAEFDGIGLAPVTSSENHRGIPVRSGLRFPRRGSP